MFYKLTLLKREVKKHEWWRRRRSHNELEDAYLVSALRFYRACLGTLSSLRFATHHLSDELRIMKIKRCVSNFSLISNKIGKVLRGKGGRKSCVRGNGRRWKIHWKTSCYLAPSPHGSHTAHLAGGCNSAHYVAAVLAHELKKKGLLRLACASAPAVCLIYNFAH